MTIRAFCRAMAKTPASTDQTYVIRYTVFTEQLPFIPRFVVTCIVIAEQEVLQQETCSLHLDVSLRLVAQALLAILDSPLSKAGKLKVRQHLLFVRKHSPSITGQSSCVSLHSFSCLNHSVTASNKGCLQHSISSSNTIAPLL